MARAQVFLGVHNRRERRCNLQRDVLYYIADPMCSWCWGFSPVLEAVSGVLPEEIPIRYVMGGLARDSAAPMPEDTRTYVQSQWRLVAERTGAEFNWDFWKDCEPRRSTYPACRAVIAAGMQRPDGTGAMFHAIQRAYYLEARNPSDAETLVQLAGELNLDTQRFSEDLTSARTDELLHEDFALRRSLHADKFPTMILEHDGNQFWLAYGYEEEALVVDLLTSALLS
ncbi:MAG: DsbA family protein [Gemmatimonadetes bacterium]|nr:DsbA family protein [Gemmatimonadota bacterium]MYB61726.1 DsbA family protein [Gemmatimonadota bacterium]